MPAPSLATGPAVCEQQANIRETTEQSFALTVKRSYAVRLKARFMRQRTNASLFSIFLRIRLYDFWLIRLHHSIVARTLVASIADLICN